MLIYTQAIWEHPGIIPRSEFNIVWCSTVDHAVLRWKAPEISLGALWGCLMVCDTFQDMTAVSQVTGLKPVMPHQKRLTPSGFCVNRRGFSNPSQLCRGRHWQDKKHYPTSQNLIGFFAHLSQNQLVAKQMFTCQGHPLLHLTLHLGCFLAHHQQSIHCFYKWLIVWAINL